MIKKKVMLPIGNVRISIDKLTDEQFIDWVRIQVGKEPHFSYDDTRGRHKQ